MDFNEYLDKVKRAIDTGAVACYIQGETADYYMENGKPEVIAKVMDLVRQNGLLVGIGAHKIETVKACVDIGFQTDFWMKTLHHHNYWSARHPDWHDNMYCFKPEETIEFMKTVTKPWLAFKVLAAGAHDPKQAFPYAFKSGADFIAVGMFDFHIKENSELVSRVVRREQNRERPWRA